MNYQIVDFDPNFGRLAVKFEDAERPVVIDIPIVGGRFLEGEALKQHIERFYPYGEKAIVARGEQLKAGIPNAVAVAAMVTNQQNVINFDPILDATLDKAIESAVKIIDAKAVAIRSKYQTPLMGQDLIYMVKRMQAQMFAAANFTGEAGSYIEAEAKQSGLSTEQVAKSMLEGADTSDLFNADLEALRVVGKRKVRDSKTVADVDALMRDTVVKMEKL